jgi:dihydroneopterin aldolase
MVEENRRLTGTLILQEISLSLRLGAFPFERIGVRRVSVDLEWAGDLFANGKPVVDYSVVCSALNNELKSEYFYIEELAGDILTVLKKKWNGNWTVTVGKAFPPVNPSVEKAVVTVSC